MLKQISSIITISDYRNLFFKNNFMKLNKCLPILALTVFMGLAAQAQTKYAVINTKYILEKIPEYKEVNFNMSISEFKVIYYWEYGHRLIARVIGLFSIKVCKNRVKRPKNGKNGQL